MVDLTTTDKNARQPSIAVMLSLVMPGLGHIYCGKLVKGLVLAFLAGIPALMFFTAMATQVSVRMPILIIALFWLLAITIIVVVDSYRLAKRVKNNYELKEYNRWYVYVILISMIAGSSVVYSFYLRDHFVEAFRIPGASMYPTIFQGDRVLADKIAYSTADPQRGDVIVFSNPDNRRENRIKRIVALAGDTVEIRNDDLYINGKKLQRQDIPIATADMTKDQIAGKMYYEINGQAKYKIILTQKSQNRPTTDFGPIKVPSHYCFCLGDNRGQSNDSRQYGPVFLATIKGRVDYIYFPAKNWSRFGRIDGR
ncbi:MAG: signal peptidase I [Phycisphaerae bacterium]